MIETLERDEKGRFKKGLIPFNKGKRPPKEQIERQRKTLKEWYKNPINEDKIKKLHEENSKKMNEFYDVLRNDGIYDEFIRKKGENISKAKKGKKFTELHKQALRQAHFTKKPEGKTIIERMSETLRKKYNSGEVKIWNKGLTKETDERMKNSAASRFHSKKWNENVSFGLKYSEIRKKYYESNKFKEGCRKGAMEARKKSQIKPNKIETKFQELCRKYSLPYKYVGDGQLWIGYKNPDFLNVDGKKEVILINGIYWHYMRHLKKNPNLTREIVEEKEKLHYKQYGFKCIIFWEDKLNEREILKRIKR